MDNFTFTVDNVIYTTKKAFIEAFTSKYANVKCYKAKTKTFPGKVEGKDKEWLIEALTKYHETISGKNSEIVNIEKEPNSGNEYHLFVYFKDGSSYGPVGKSFILNYGKDTFMDKLKQSCRKAADVYIDEYKKELFNKIPVVKCTISGEMLEKDECHIDHEYPYTFDYIFNEFISELNIIGFDIRVIEFVKCSDSRGGYKFANDNHKNWFTEFHSIYNEYLRPISKTLNMKLGNRQTFKDNNTSDVMLLSKAW